MHGRMTRRSVLALAAVPMVQGAPAVREVPVGNRFNIRVEEGWYMHSVGLAAYPDGELVCTYRRSDEHIASVSEAWCCRSKDGGRTWTDHKLISRSAWDPDKACWVAPQLGQGRDGTLYLLIDRGQKKSKFDWPITKYSELLFLKTSTFAENLFRLKISQCMKLWKENSW